MLTDIDVVTQQERDMYWEEIEELSFTSGYKKGHFYTALKNGVKVLFIQSQILEVEYLLMDRNVQLFFREI